MSPKESPRKNSADEPESFEQALERLEELVQELEAGEIPLEKSVRAFEEGQKLITFCEKKLKSAEQALKQLSRDAKDMLGDDHANNRS